MNPIHHQRPETPAPNDVSVGAPAYSLQDASTSNAARRRFSEQCLVDEGSPLPSYVDSITGRGQGEPPTFFDAQTTHPGTSFSMWETVEVRKGRHGRGVRPGMVGQVVHQFLSSPPFYAVALAEADVCEIYQGKHLRTPRDRPSMKMTAIERALPKSYLVEAAGFATWRQGMSQDEMIATQASANDFMSQIKEQVGKNPALLVKLPALFERLHGPIYEVDAEVRSPTGRKLKMSTSWTYSPGGPSEPDSVLEMVIAMPLSIVPSTPQ